MLQCVECQVSTNHLLSIATLSKSRKIDTYLNRYVALCLRTIPAPRKKHAVVMARFASTCASKMIDVCRELEVTLGPDTSDLRMRVGLHSGPVTAGVLRGDKGRFQVCCREHEVCLSPQVCFVPTFPFPSDLFRSSLVM